MVVDLLFYVFSGLMVLSALMVVSLKNPVHAVLFLIFAFFNAAGLFLLLGAELLAMLLVIVYVGAVAILFLFVVMMLNVDQEQVVRSMKAHLPIGLVLAVAMLLEIVAVIGSSIKGIELAPQAAEKVTESGKVLTNVDQIGMVLYTDYIFLFQSAGLVLLVAMVGAIVLTNRVRGDVRRQSVPEQLARDTSTVSLARVPAGKGVEPMETR